MTAPAAPSPVSANDDGEAVQFKLSALYARMAKASKGPARLGDPPKPGREASIAERRKWEEQCKKNDKEMATRDAKFKSEKQDRE